MAQKIIEVDGVSQYKSDYSNYAVYIIGTRVTADFRDGLSL